MNIDSIGSKTIDLLFDKGLVRTPVDLYALRYATIYPLEGFQEVATKRLLQGIAQSRKMPFENVLFALGIRHVGETVAEKIAKHFKHIDALVQATAEEMIVVPEVGEKIARSIIDYLQDPEHLQLIAALKTAGLQFMIQGGQATPASQHLAAKTLVISGTFQAFGREELKALIRRQGGKLSAAVANNVDYLVAGNRPGPAKLARAQELGTEVLSEEKIIKMLGL